jgi:hypothetical protein
MTNALFTRMISCRYRHYILSCPDISSMVGSLRDLFFHPDTFFAHLPPEKAEFFWPFVIVAIGSVVNFAGAVVTSPPVTDPLTQYSITFLSLLAAAIATWIIISAGLFLLSRAFSGTGSYLATLRNTGYGMFPFVFSGVVTLVSVAVIMGNQTSISLIPSVMFSALIYAEQMVFTIWVAYLWYCGIRNAQGIPSPLAAAAVVIVTALALALFFILTTMSLH